ncbi:MAG: R3H domain-containing nucleic acid-binding protein [Armatimonadota bacterium]|jgi:stage III sporulation protein SpoIIIAA
MPRAVRITHDIERLLAALPEQLQRVLHEREDIDELLEVVLDLGRRPEARFPDDGFVYLDEQECAPDGIEYVVARIGEFGHDNRAGIRRTLHRVSAIRNRTGAIVGLTCRVGRAVYGTIDVIRDVVESGRNILLLGRPGVGKTTMLREVARVLSDEFDKRVIVVDTSNEIAGDGDIPHPAIGRARRMQVERPERQHDVMIEAVENHMPEVIIIDEIGTEQDAFAARTIAERGVQLVGTAHGNTLTNLYQNPTLCDLIGGIQAVTLGDEEARRRKTQKTVLERKASPTFDIVVEIMEIDRLSLHSDVAATVDALLRGQAVKGEHRVRTSDGGMEVVQREELPQAGDGRASRAIQGPDWLPAVPKIHPSGVSRRRLEKAMRELRVPASVVMDARQADLVIVLGSPHDKRRKTVSKAPEFTVHSDTYGQLYECLRSVFNVSETPREELALKEVEDALSRVLTTNEPAELTPQNAYIRRLQHEYVSRHNLRSSSVGREPRRRVRVIPA